MLTTDTRTWPDGTARLLWVIEFDTEYGTMQAFGPAEIYRERDHLESDTTGGCYSEPQVIASMVEIRSAGSHYLAVFDDEPSMLAGAHMIATAWAGTLPAPIWLVLIAPQEDRTP